MTAAQSLPGSEGNAPARNSGFTIIELLVVLAIIALLLTLAAPRYWNSITRAQEDVLKENLYLLRDAIDKHYADRGQYPESIEQLVEKRYLRFVPADPVTGSTATWTPIPPGEGKGTGVFDVRSGAPGTGRNGIPYGQW